MQEPSSINYSKVIKSLYIIGALFIITYIITLSINLSQESATKAGSIGDAIGGLANPFIGTIGVILTFFAFWVQFEANERQRKAYEEQRKDIKRERFENKFYELLKLHKENVNEIRIPLEGGLDLNGRECFRVFYDELESIYHCGLGIRNEKQYDIDNERLLDFSYEVFHYGLDYGHEHIYKKSDNPNGDFLIDFFKILKKNRSVWEKKNLAIGEVKSRILMSDSIKLFRFDHKPFSGGYLFLGHYYRHFYQILKFIDTSEVLTQKEKYEFVKILRASLSSFELTTLYLNSFWGSGKKLWEDIDEAAGTISRYMIDYKLIKNINFHLVDFAIHPKFKFKQELKRAFPEKEEKWINETVFNSFEELENLRVYY
jgi:hypothetical protein